MTDDESMNLGRIIAGATGMGIVGGIIYDSIGVLIGAIVGVIIGIFANRLQHRYNKKDMEQG